MEAISADVVNLLKYLTPGFIAAWIFYSLTGHLKPSQFERVVQALIMTFIIQLIVVILKIIFVYIGKKTNFVISDWTETTSVIWSTLLSFIYGLSFSYLCNNDCIHSLLRKLKFTKESSSRREWLETPEFRNAPITLHLKNNKRIHGWPKETNSALDVGHFLLEKAAWLNKDDGFEDVFSKYVMIKSSEIEYVEIYEKEE
ncbi:DUF6338 family protein [Rahnella aceris]|jgi:hypothetical protein